MIKATHNAPLGAPPWSDALRLPGIPAEGGSAEARLAWFSALSTQERVERLHQWLLATRAEALPTGQALASWVGVAAGELLAGPFTLRAAAMGIGEGALVARHERRTCLHWRADLRGAAGAIDQEHGEWIGGALVAGRYQSFCLDGAFALMNPNHSARWTAHELLHRAVGFAWAPDLSPWEQYQLSRLAELLPVAHWYGLDRFCRLDERGPYERAQDAQRPESPLTKALWLDETAEVLMARVTQCAPMLLSALEHIELELRAYDSERETLRLTPAEHDLLNSSSDALAYVAGHGARLRDADVAQLLQAVSWPRPAADYAEMRGRLLTTLDTLLFGELVLEPETVHSRACGRLLWDICQRSVHLLRSVDSIISWDAVASACEAAYAGDPGPATTMLGQLAATLPRREEILTTGVNATITQDQQITPLEQLEEGVHTVAPATCAWLVLCGGLEEVLLSLAASPTRGPLIARLRHIMEARSVEDSVGLQLVRFEMALLAATRRDDRCEHLSMSPESAASDAWIEASEAFESLAFEFDVPEFAWQLREDDAASPPPGAGQWLVGNVGGEVHVVHLQGPLAAVWAALPCHRHEAQSIVDAVAPEWRDDWLLELAGAGAVVVLPHAPQRRP